MATCRSIPRLGPLDPFRLVATHGDVQTIGESHLWRHLPPGSDLGDAGPASEEEVVEPRRLEASPVSPTGAATGAGAQEDGLLFVVGMALVAFVVASFVGLASVAGVIGVLWLGR